MIFLPFSPGRIEQRQRHARGLAGARRRHQHGGVVAGERAVEFIEHGVDRQRAIELVRQGTHRGSGTRAGLASSWLTIRDASRIPSRILSRSGVLDHSPAEGTGERAGFAGTSFVLIKEKATDRADDRRRSRRNRTHR